MSGPFVEFKLLNCDDNQLQRSSYKEIATIVKWVRKHHFSFILTYDLNENIRTHLRDINLLLIPKNVGSLSYQCEYNDQNIFTIDNLSYSKI
jgi:uncharacterized Zn finger protein